MTDSIPPKSISRYATLTNRNGRDRPEREWTVVPLVVTRRVDPAAFAVNPRLSFCVADDVIDIVDRDQLPGPGFHEGT